MFFFTNLGKIFIREHHRLAAAKPLKQFYHPLISGILDVN